MQTMMKPIVNLNGTSGRELIERRMDAMRATEALMEALQKMRPHGRDYMGNDERYNSDLDIYKARFASLDAMRNSFMDEALAIKEAI